VTNTSPKWQRVPTLLTEAAAAVAATIGAQPDLVPVLLQGQGWGCLCNQGGGLHTYSPFPVLTS
jgi:hypothetical protein